MSEWFEGEVEGGPHSAAFLGGVRELAPLALDDLVSADATSAFPYGCLITVEVPGIPPREWPVHSHMIQVMFEPTLLGGYWGCSYLWDDYDASDPEALSIHQALAPARAAEIAIEWIRGQLARPRVREEWDRRLFGTAYRWVLADTGRVVAGRRPRWRGPPDRAHRLEASGH